MPVCRRGFAVLSDWIAVFRHFHEKKSQKHLLVKIVLVISRHQNRKE